MAGPKLWCMKYDFIDLGCGKKMRCLSQEGGPHGNITGVADCRVVIFDGTTIGDHVLMP